MSNWMELIEIDKWKYTINWVELKEYNFKKINWMELIEY